MLELKPRVTFAGQPWPTPVSFDIPWLKGVFYPAQLSRKERITSAIADGETRIEKVRAEAAGNVPTFGERRSNGTIYRTGNDQALQAAAHSVAQRQTVDAIRKIRLEIDAKVLADLQNMERASLTARTLMERVWDKISTLSRASGGMNTADVVTFKANYTQIIRGVAAIELHRLAQNAIDDGSPLSLVMLDCIRTENFGRKTNDRPFLNQALLDLIQVPEFTESVGDDAKPGLLRQVISLHKEAGTAWANFLGKVGQVSIQRIARGLADIRLDDTSVPVHGAE